MIGHYLLTLSTEQEDRVLETHLGDAPYETADGSCRCLVGAAENVRRKRGTIGIEDLSHIPVSGRQGEGFADRVGLRFDGLCRKFGAPRVNAAIRSRIWSNRARRILQNAPVSRDTEVVESVR